MKKIIATLLCVVLSFSLFTVTSFAAAFSSMTTSATGELSVGDTFTVTVSVPDMTVSTYTTGIQFDKDVLECTSFVGADPAYPTVDLVVKGVRGNTYVTADPVSTIDMANSSGTASGFWSGTSDREIVGGVLMIATFKVKEGAVGTTKINLFEDRAGGNGSEQNNTAQEITITIKGAAPVEDKSITTADPTTGADVKTWNVTLGKDFDGTTLKATLTNSAADEDNKTQDVTLNLPTLSGEAAYVFDINVKFRDFANAATTTLAVTAE